MFGEDLWFEFWKMYPKKMAFKNTKVIWMTLAAEQQKKAIESLPMHVRLWTLECRSPQFIPMPFSWLSGERWEDEIQLPEPRGQEWWKSDQATMERGRALKCPSRPGETMEEYRNRLRRAA